MCFIPEKGYCVLLARSESGGIDGPWKEQRIIYDSNGGHGMIFRAFNGRWMLALHQPNDSPDERLRLFYMVDNGETLEVEDEMCL